MSFIYYNSLVPEIKYHIHTFFNDLTRAVFKLVCKENFITKSKKKKKYIQTVELCIKNNELNLLKWMVKCIPFTIKLTDKACYYGSLSILNWLYINGYPWFPTTSVQAAKTGHINILRWTRRHALSTYTDYEICITAAKYGHLSTLKWARKHGYVWDKRVCSAAFKYGRLKILKWCVSKGAVFDENSMTHTNSLKMIKWCVVNWSTLTANAPIIIFIANNLSRAATNGNLNIIKWGSIHYNNIFNHLHIDLLASKNNNFHIIKWMYNNSYHIAAKCIDNAASNGNINIIKWFYSIGIMGTAWTCTFAALGGHLETLKYLYSMNVPLRSEVCEDAIANGTRRGLKVLIWAIKNGCPLGPNVLAAAVINNNLNLVKYLRSLNPPCPWNETACHEACFNGNLEMLKLLRNRWIKCPWDSECYHYAKISESNNKDKILKYLKTNKCPK